MGRYTGPTDRLSRREGINLMLKGERSINGKSERRLQTPPGAHNWRRGRVSDYGLRLREKQKVKRYYGIRDRQFMNTFKNGELTMNNAFLIRKINNAVFIRSISFATLGDFAFINIR